MFGISKLCLLLCIFILYGFLQKFSCYANVTIDNLETVESLSEIALLKHHPQSAYSNSSNVTQSFALLLEDLQSHNYTQEPVTLNCSSLSKYPFLPRHLCDDGIFSKCLSANDMLQLVPPSTKSVSEALARVCPLLLLQLHNGACSSGDNDPPSLRPSTMAVWGYGLLFVTIISCCSLVGVIILPLLSKNIYQIVLMLFEGLAVGSLVGSSLFHLIPQTFKLVGQDKEHNYLWRSLLIFGGIYLFYVSERFMKVIMDIKKARKSRKPNLGYGDNSAEFLKPLPETNHSGNGLVKNGKYDKARTNSTPQILTAENLSNHNSYKLINESSSELKALSNDDDEPPHNHHTHHHEHTIHFEKGQSAIGTVAWMIIFGDGLHNFIDGLSIGAAFSESILAGVSISVAVICEEFPHELGDFAVLLSAGMTMRQALLYNFLSAITCYLGLVMGILLGDFAEGAPYIFALAAGMFLYISLVDMLGELSEALEEARKKGIKKQLKVFLIQNIGIALGVAILFVMARYAEHFNFENLTAFSSNSEEQMDERVKQFYSGFQEAKNLQSLLTN
ncbi:metal cation symporter ZIP14 [Parasteatoda tepidariorum]|uniref:metal cation symporter ZIP14 n=1 Tax=Parasteatoda tepidariorum TaxID=114398 RepID=UPI00077FD493|nr:metal cation symporter ZIP14-like [Parasteatoda tepidariorum]XP_015920205.1 metal cation symporter ZIP14-like [Parasteatoda tepidariorum]XP_015920207.1 metal cation symporter ZIP14-like [Parasteatoda tepidariorum]